jgi:hypothetical protein
MFSVIRIVSHYEIRSKVASATKFEVAAILRSLQVGEGSDDSELGPGAATHSARLRGSRLGENQPQRRKRNMSTSSAIKALSVKATVTNHLQAFFDQDIDGVVRDYAADAVLITRDGPMRGVAEIRAFFTQFIGGLPAGFLQSFKLHRQEFLGDVGYIIWDALPWASLGTDTFLVHDGKIVLQTFASYPASW